ncbi:Rhomboid-related protein 2 [Anabarilius grahami]|uniref:rhomboid protease n=1 Tax=Anabarilius grahami TaxID=495550 RepID=A0A3N0XRT6_ANAGA|nr:Rhomboid-related protein 2 [Anabarilius grahami]
MGDNDIEEQDTFPVERDEEGDNRANPKRRGRRVEKIQKNVSKWMLPEELRETYLERANCCPPPIFIILISLAELGVFIYYAVWKPQKQWITLGTGIWESPLTYKPEQREEAWRFLSYMFVHAGVEHIMGNLLMQLLLGIPLELVHKGFEVGMVYMAGVLAVGTDVGFAIYRRFFSHDVAMKVSFVAHIGGGVAGMTIGYVFFTNYNKELLKDPRFWMCIVGYIAFFLFAVIFNIFLSPAPA